jgi:NADPH:quinone reductase-like Zn-dependent oxidoreductase
MKIPNGDTPHGKGSAAVADAQAAGGRTTLRTAQPTSSASRLKELIDAGRYRAVIDRSYTLEDVVNATRCVETEQKTGNVVLTVSRA